MRNITIIIIIGFSFIFPLNITLGDFVGPIDPRTFCEVWAEANPTSEDVCTELIEGIPVSSLGTGMTCVGPKPGDSTICLAFTGPTGFKAFSSYVGMYYKYAGWAIGFLAVMMVIVGGIQMSIGGASQEQVTAGKKRIYMALGGVILFLLIGVILRTINPVFFQ